MSSRSVEMVCGHKPRFSPAHVHIVLGIVRMHVQIYDYFA